MFVFRAAVNRALHYAGRLPKRRSSWNWVRVQAFAAAVGRIWRLSAQLKAAVRWRPIAIVSGLDAPGLVMPEGSIYSAFCRKKGDKCDPNDTGATKLRSLETVVFDG